jgi:hypothetical protein
VSASRGAPAPAKWRPTVLRSLRPVARASREGHLAPQELLQGSRGNLAVGRLATRGLPPGGSRASRGLMEQPRESNRGTKLRPRDAKEVFREWGGQVA